MSQQHVSTSQILHFQKIQVSFSFSSSNQDLSLLFRDDINTTNVLGAGGELAEKFAELMGEMWGGEYSVCAPRNLKSKIERLAPQFAG